MSHFEQELADFKNQLLTMAGHAEKAVKRALQALTERNCDLALQVKAEDRILDQFEIAIDDLAIHLLAKAPLASDLRLIAVGMKISQNLERVGDEASKISNRARELSQEPPLKFTLDLPKMSALALDMLKTALDSFVNNNPAAA